MSGAVVVEFRRIFVSQEADRRVLAVGLTLAEIVAEFPVPPEFELFGAVMIARGDEMFPMEVPRHLWHLARPKADTAIFVSCRPQFGGDSGQVFQIIGAIALVALVTWVSAGGLAPLMAPALAGAFSAGGIGASVAGAAIGVAGQAALALLNQPSAGAAGPAAAPTAGLGAAGVAGNPIGAFQQIPAVLGTMRVSPPFMTRPYTSIDDTVLTVHGVVGLCGPLKIEDLKVNETDVADLPDFEFEPLEGWPDDPELTLVSVSAFEENINLEVSRHRLEDDQLTLIAPHADSYPRPHIFKTCRRCDLFRVLLAFPQGLIGTDSGGDDETAVALFRIRIRNRAGGGWINLPEIAIADERRTPFRTEIRLQWTLDEGGNESLEKSIGDSTARWAYYSNTEWQADSYFFESGSGSPTINDSVLHVRAVASDVTIFLDPDVFAIGEWDVEITRSALVLVTDTTASVYPGGLFTYRSFSAPDYRIPSQASLIGTTYIQNHASFRNAYPILERGLTLIAFRARNVQVQSISALFSSYVPVWNGADWDTVAVSSNPAALLRWVLAGSLNARPIPLAILETLGDFYDHCVAEGLECHALITSGSVEQAAGLAAQCGDAILRRSDKWGVVIDMDRSEETPVAMFGPHNMTEPLAITITYLIGSRGLVPSFYDETRDFAVTELDRPIYDDGVPTDDTTLVEGVVYDGLTSEALVRRRARLDLRRARMRAIRYSWGVHQEHLNCRKGDLVAVGHDVLINSWATGRVEGFSSAGGDLVSITLDTVVEDKPASGYDDLFSVDDVFLLKDVFALEGAEIGIQVRLATGAVVMIPVSGVAGATLFVEGTVAVPAGLESGCIVSVGPRTRETRRVIIADIRPGSDLFANITAFDEAPGIFEGL